MKPFVKFVFRKPWHLFKKILRKAYAEEIVSIREMTQSAFSCESEFSFFGQIPLEAYEAANAGKSFVAYGNWSHLLSMENGQKFKPSLFCVPEKNLVPLAVLPDFCPENFENFIITNPEISKAILDGNDFLLKMRDKIANSMILPFEIPAENFAVHIDEIRKKLHSVGFFHVEPEIVAQNGFYRQKLEKSLFIHIAGNCKCDDSEKAAEFLKKNGAKKIPLLLKASRLGEYE